MLWLQGPSGVGKSTFLCTLAGWLQPASGRILLNGQELQLYQDSTLRHHIGLLSQQVSLFNMSLAANLRLAKPQASDEEQIKRDFKGMQKDLNKLLKLSHIG